MEMALATATETLLYSELASDPDLAEIVELFVDEMPRRVANLESRFERRDWLELERAAHQIKGAAGSYGFNQLTPAATALEVIVKQRRDEAEIKSALEALTTLCRSVRGGVPS
jgi:HPt (histidine-containing phosphotransfer) domain-containing protein